MAHKTSDRERPPRVASPFLGGGSPEIQVANLRTKVDQMRAHISQLKQELDAEKATVKRLKHDRVAELRKVREEEQRKSGDALKDLRSRLAEEKNKELEQLRESLTKQINAERNKVLKHKDAMSRNQGEQQRETEAFMQKTKHQYWLEAKEEAKKSFEAEKTRFINETEEMRRIIKTLESDREIAAAADRQRSGDLKRILGDHNREMDQLKKDARKDIIRLVDELKAKDRVIGEMEKELGQQAGHALKLQAEKESLGHELNLAKMTETWERRSKGSESSPDQAGILSEVSRSGDTTTEDQPSQRIGELTSKLSRLDEQNRRLASEKADLEKKLRSSPLPRSAIPLPKSREGDTQLQKKIKELEAANRKLDARCKTLVTENQKLKSAKSKIPTPAADRAGKHTPGSGRGRGRGVRQDVTPQRGMSDAATEVQNLKRQVEEQFKEIVELKQAAQERQQITTSGTHSPVNHLEGGVAPDSMSLSEDDVFRDDVTTPASLDASVTSMNTSDGGRIETSSPVFLPEAMWMKEREFYDEQMTLLKKKVLEIEETKSRMEWSLQKAQEQNELLEFRILELEEMRGGEGDEAGGGGGDGEEVKPILSQTSSSPTGITYISQVTHTDNFSDQTTPSQFNSLQEQVTLQAIPELKQKLDYLFSKEGCTFTEEQNMLLIKVSAVLQSAHQKNLEIQDLEGEATSLRRQLEVQMNEMERMRMENSKLVKDTEEDDGKLSATEKQLRDADKEQAFKERIEQLEQLLREQNFHIETLCNQHAKMEEDLEKQKLYIAELEGAKHTHGHTPVVKTDDREDLLDELEMLQQRVVKLEKTEKNLQQRNKELEFRVTTLLQDGFHSSYMETSTERSDSEIQVESLWEEIEGAKSSRDSQSSQVKDDSQNEDTSVVEELFQVLEKGVKKPLHVKGKMDVLPKKEEEKREAEEEDLETGEISDEDTDNSSFSLPLPDDEVEEDTPRKLSLRQKMSEELFGDRSDQSKEDADSVSEVDGIEDLTEADAAARVNGEKHAETDLEEGEGTTKDGAVMNRDAEGHEDVSNEGDSEESDEEPELHVDLNEDEILARLSGTVEQSHLVNEREHKPQDETCDDNSIGSDNNDGLGDFDDDDTQTEISELLSQNDQLKTQCKEKDVRISEMEETSRTLKQVIRDQMAEVGKLRGNSVDENFEEKLAESKMKEDTLKRVVKDLQTSEQQLKEQLNKLIEEKEEMASKIVEFEDKLGQLHHEETEEKYSNSRCAPADERLKELEQLNVQIVEKYEIELAEKDEKIQKMQEECMKVKELTTRNEKLAHDMATAEEDRTNLQILREEKMTLSENLACKEADIRYLTDRLASVEISLKDSDETRNASEILKGKVTELEDELEKAQAKFARKCSENAQLHAQLTMVQEECENKLKHKSIVIEELQGQLSETGLSVFDENYVQGLEKHQEELVEKLLSAEKRIQEYDDKAKQCEDQFAQKVAEVVKLRAQIVLYEEQVEFEVGEKNMRNEELNEVKSQMEDLMREQNDNRDAAEELLKAGVKIEEMEKEMEEERQQFLKEIASNVADNTQLHAKLAILEENVSTKLSGKDKHIRELEKKLSDVQKRDLDRTSDQEMHIKMADAEAQIAGLQRLQEDIKNSSEIAIASNVAQLAEAKANLCIVEEKYQTELNEKDAINQALSGDNCHLKHELEILTATLKQNEENKSEVEEKLKEARNKLEQLQNELDIAQSQVKDCLNLQESLSQTQTKLAKVEAEKAALHAKFMRESKLSPKQSENVLESPQIAEDFIVPFVGGSLEAALNGNDLTCLNDPGSVEVLQEMLQSAEEELTSSQYDELSSSAQIEEELIEPSVQNLMEFGPHMNKLLTVIDDGPVEELKKDLNEKTEMVENLQDQIQILEAEKGVLEERLKGIEDLLQNSVIENEDMLRERIVELEMVEKTLKRRVQELEMSLRDAVEKLESTQVEMKDLEDSYEERFKEIRTSEQRLMEEAAELEEDRTHWRSEAESHKERVEDLESLNQDLKQQLQETKDELEELQVVTKFTGDELGSTQHSLPSLMEEGLGALDTGRSHVSHFDDNDEEIYTSDEDDHSLVSETVVDENLQKGAFDSDDMHDQLTQRVKELEKSEAELMEKVEILQQAEFELSELVQSQQQVCEVNLDSENRNLEELQDVRRQMLEKEQSLDAAKERNQELQEQIAVLEVEKEELLLKLEEFEELNQDNKETDLDVTVKELFETNKSQCEDLEKMAERNSVLEVKVNELEEQLEKMKSVLTQSEMFEHELQQANKASENFQEKISQLELENSDLSRKLTEYDKVKKDLTETTGKLEELTQINKDLENQVNDYEAVNEELLNNLAEMEATKTESESVLLHDDSLAKMEEENVRIAEKLRQAEEEREAFQERMKTMAAEIEFLEQQKLGEEQSVVELSFQVETLQDECASKSKMLDQNASILEERISELNKTQRELDDTKEVCKELERMKQHFEDDCAAKTEVIDQTNTILESKVKELQAALKELQSAQETCEELKKKVLDLEEENEKLGTRIAELENKTGVVTDVAETVEAKDTAGEFLSPSRPSNYVDDDDDDDDVDRVETAPTIEALQLRIQHLMDNEERLMEKIYELEQRQIAFNETLQQADSIMMERESSFTEKIDELQSSQSDLKHQLEESRREEERLKRRLSEISRDEDASIFDCMDDDEYDIQDDIIEEEDEELPSHHSGKESVHSDETQLKELEKSRKDLANMLAQSQESEADLMIKVGNLEKEKDELKHALVQEQEKIRKAVMSTDIDMDNNVKQALQERLTATEAETEKLKLTLSEAQQKNKDKEHEVITLKSRLGDLEALEDQFQQFLKEKDLNEADRDILGSLAGASGNEVHELKAKVSELERKHKLLKEELKQTQMSEQTMTEISEEQAKEIQKLKEDLGTRQLADNELSSDKGNVAHLQETLAKAYEENNRLSSQVKQQLEEINELKKTEERPGDQVDSLNAHVEELKKSENRLIEELRKNKEKRSQLERTVKALEESIEMLTSRLQESEMGQDGVKASNKILENKFKDMLVSEGVLKQKLKRLEDSDVALKERVVLLQDAEEDWKKQVQDLEEVIHEAKKQNRSMEEQIKLLKHDNNQLRHENEMMGEKVDLKRSLEEAAQTRLSEMEIGESTLRLRLKNAEMREEKLKQEIQELMDTISSLKQKASGIGQLESEIDSLQDDLQAANRRTDEGMRSKVKLEEQLKQLQDSLHSNNMVTLTVADYQELKAQARLASLTDVDQPEGGGGTGEVWMRLDQKNKELREVQELYNQSVRECMTVKQALRDLQVTHDALQSGRGRLGPYKGLVPTITEVKSTQTVPLKYLTKGALNAKLMAGGEEINLGEFLDALPQPDTLLTKHQPCSLVRTDQDILEVDQSAASPRSNQPIREHLIGREVGPVAMATRSLLEDGFEFGEGQLDGDEIDRLRVGPAADQDHDLSFKSDTPPLPDTSPPGYRRSRGRTGSTSSDRSDVLPPPPLPSQPPPSKSQAGLDEEDGGSMSFPMTTETIPEFSSQQSHVRAPSFDSGLETLASTTEPDIEATSSQGTFTGPTQLQLPNTPGTGGRKPPPTVAPKPGTPLWLKQMMDWQNAEKEKEQGEVGRLRARVEELTRIIDEQEQQLRELKFEREQLKRQVQGASDARELQQKLQNRDLEMEEKERQVTRLRTEMKEREMEIVRLKSQLERTQEQLRTKEQLLHSHDASLGRLKADLVSKETELISKDNLLQVKTDEASRLQERLQVLEEEQRTDTSKRQLAEYSSMLASLTSENDTLQSRVAELEPMERHVADLHAELRKSGQSARSQEALERKLQQAQKLLQEKMEKELRLAEDNVSLQQRVRTMATEDNYTKDLEKDYRKVVDQLETMEHERNEAELSVAPLKAKVSYLTKKCHERDNLIRKLKREIGRSQMEKASDLLKEISQLSTLLPQEEYNEPLSLGGSRQRNQTGLNHHDDAKKHSFRSSRMSGTSPDMSGLLSSSERDFLRRETQANRERDITKDNDDGGDGEMSLEELLHRTSRRQGVVTGLDDLNLEELEVLESLDELHSDHSQVSSIGLGGGQSPLTVTLRPKRSTHQARVSYTKRKSPPIQPAPAMPVGIDAVDGQINGHLATQQHSRTPPSGVTTHSRLLGDDGVRQMGSMATPAGGMLANGNSHPPLAAPMRNFNDLMTVPMATDGLGYRSPQLLNNKTLQTAPAPTTSLSGPPHPSRLPASVPGASDRWAPSLGASLPLNHQNLLNLPTGGGPFKTQYGGASLIPMGGGGAVNGTSSPGAPSPPKSLSVSRVVSKHSVLLSWIPPDMDALSRSNGAEVVGYRVFVNGQQKQLVASAHMRKALVDGIYIKNTHRFGICSVGVTGETSTTTEVAFDYRLASLPPSTMSESGISGSTPDLTSDLSSVVSEDTRERTFMAVYSYDPDTHSPNDNPDYELAFVEGDLITIYGSMRQDGFYHGKVRGQKGLVPSNFIEEIPMSDVKGKQSQRAHRESHHRKSRDSVDGRRAKEGKKGRAERRGSDRESRRREGQSHRGSRV